MTLSPPLAGIMSAAAAVPARLRSGYGTRLLVGESSLTLLLLIAICLGFAVRYQHLAAAGSFPINDGGMFYAMVNDVRQAHYALPEYTSYNGGIIPFAYSPLPFYLAAGLADGFRISVLDVLRYLPLVASTLSIPAFYLLARALMPTRSMAVLASFIFAFTPRAFAWEIAGGGLTRAPGFTFAILAVYCLYTLTREPTYRKAVLAALAVALTALCHMEMAAFVAWSYTVILVAYGRNPRALAYAAAVTAAVVALTAPWWGAVISMHGLDPFLAAGRTGSQSLLAPTRFLFLDYTDEPFLPVLAALGILGFLASLAGGRYLLPVWLVVVFILDPRKAPTYASIPMAMLAAEVTLGLLVPALQQLHWPSRPSRVAAMLPSIVVIYCMLSATAAAVVITSPLKILAPPEVEAMRWAGENTPPESRFLVVVGREPGPWIDVRSEWFPALSNRVSLATVQGSEWLPGESGMDPSVDRYDWLQMCVDRDAACLTAWADDHGRPFSHVYIANATEASTNEQSHGRLLQRDCCAALRASLATSPDYRLVYDGEASLIYELVVAESAPSGDTQ